MYIADPENNIRRFYRILRVRSGIPSISGESTFGCDKRRRIDNFEGAKCTGLRSLHLSRTKMFVHPPEHGGLAPPIRVRYRDQFSGPRVRER